MDLRGNINFFYSASLQAAFPTSGPISTWRRRLFGVSISAPHADRWDVKKTTLKTNQNKQTRDGDSSVEVMDESEAANMAADAGT